jgi:hypothetical protein
MIICNNRKDTLPVQIVEKYNYEIIINEISALNLLDRNYWDGINFGQDIDNKFRQIALTHSNYYGRWFNFKNKQYQDLFLNEIDYTLINKINDEDFTSRRSRARVVTDMQKLREQHNAEFIFKPQLKKQFRNTYLEEVINDIGSRFAGGSGRAKIGWMAHGTVVGEHIDADSSMVLKVHIPLVTNPEVKFYVKYKETLQEYHMLANGTAYLLNTGLPHSVKNNGINDRYHLIVNVYNR